MMCEQFRKLVCEHLATLFCVRCACSSASAARRSASSADDDDVQLHELHDINNHRQQQPATAEPELTEATGQALVSATERILVNIRDLLETSVRAMTRQRHEKREAEHMMADWLTAAAVIDRMCFLLVTIFFIGGTVALIVLTSLPRN